MFSKDVDPNVRLMKEKLCCGTSFDLINRTIYIAGRKSGFFFLDGFAKDAVMEKMIEYLTKLTPEEMDARKTPEDFAAHFITYTEMDVMYQPDDVVTEVLSGQVAFIIDGFACVFLVDARTYPARGVEEPEDDRVLRGSHDGFVETLVFNTALIRRRIRDPQLTMEIFRIGTTSQTDVVLCYMEKRVDKRALEAMRKKLKSITIPALNMGQESLSECLLRRKWYNPFPRIRYTERPDCAAASVAEGKLLLLVDNCASVMILPTAIFDFVQDTNDYYFPPIVGSYLRIVRAIIFLATLLLTPVWFLFIKNPEMIPDWLAFIRIKEPNGVPVIAQLLIVELVIDGIKLASLNTPGSLNNAFSVVGALLLGEFAVNAGIFVAEVLLYMAFVAVANFTQPSFELGYTFKLFRMLLLVLTALFNWWGFAGGIVLMLVLIATAGTVPYGSYLYPLIPFDAKALHSLLLRRPISRFNTGRNP